MSLFAVMAGIKHSKGDWAIIMDDDFQHSPTEASKLINYALNNKYDVVYGDYREKQHGFIRNLMKLYLFQRVRYIELRILIISLLK